MDSPGTGHRLAVPLAGIAAGCDTFVHGQVAVPDSNQRLAAGADGVPSKQVWVIENGKAERVKIVTEDQQ